MVLIGNIKPVSYTHLNEATYKVTYSAGEVTTKEVKKGKDTTKQNVVKYHDETTLRCV